MIPLPLTPTPLVLPLLSVLLLLLSLQQRVLLQLPPRLHQAGFGARLTFQPPRLPPLELPVEPSLPLTVFLQNSSSMHLLLLLLLLLRPWRPTLPHKYARRAP